MDDRKHIVIVGGGFGGLAAARALGGHNVRVTVIDRYNHHLFQPLLYQVATAGLAPGDITEPIRSLLKRHRNIDVRLAVVASVDVEGRQVLLEDGGAMPYDMLVVAAGARHSYFGHPEWEANAPGLKTLGDALEMRRRVLLAFERAEWASDPAERARLLTFVVVGGGPTGVELAGALAEIACKTMRREFHHIDTSRARIVLVEGVPQLLTAFEAPLPEKAQVQLEELGVEIRLGKFVSAVDARGVELGGVDRIEAATVLWAAGNEASPLGRSLGVPLDKAGRVLVEPDLSIPGHPEIFVVGDQASFVHQTGRPLPGVAQVAQQAGRHAARNALSDLWGRQREPFRYADYGGLATIGKRRAVGEIRGIKLSGFAAWLVWAVVHLWTLVSFRNRLVVFLKWAWAWFTWQSSSRVVWQRAPLLPPPDEAPATK